MKELLISIMITKGISEFIHFGMVLCGIVAIALTSLLILDRKKAAYAKSFDVPKEVHNENDA